MAEGEFYIPNGEQEFVAPFGPVIGYKKMPQELVDYLNDNVEQPLQDWSNRLVGKVKEERLFTPEISETFCSFMADFIFSWYKYLFSRAALFTKVLDEETYKYNLDVSNGWYVRQHENEFNPVHIHTGCDASSVGFLALPEGIQQEWEEDEKDHYSAVGNLNFFHGEAGNWYDRGSFLVRPRVGDFYIFPNGLRHCVYPFKTVGERRSFSINFTLEEKKR